MAFTVSLCTEDDFADLRLPDVVFDSVGGRSNILNAIHPKNDTVTGRRNALEIFKASYRNPTQRFLKATDSDGQIVGLAQYAIFEDLADGQFSYVLLSGPEGNWETEQDKEYAQCMVQSLIDTRNKMLPDRPQSIICLSKMCISPASQRKGAGSQLMQWGCDLADSMGLDMILDSTPEGKRLYLKHGFEIQFVEELNVPPEFADRPKQILTFMRRLRGATGQQ